jgi:hypothetical protein
MINIDPLVMDHNGPVIERGYRETSRFQWARETCANSIEAGAKRVLFGLEWQGVTAHGVYRRLIADNGDGMNAGELHRFFKTYGGGGKRIGDAHDNYGIGAKTTLLPWNQLGVIVISWQNGEGNMIRIRHDPESGDYGLHQYEILDDEDNVVDIASVVDPDFTDPEFDINWSSCKPEWIDNHGTVIVLLGNTLDQDTIEGDPNRNEQGLRTLTGYMNARFWEIPGTLQVLEFANTDRDKWPKSNGNRLRTGDLGSGYMNRSIYGAKHYVAIPSTFSKHDLQTGTVHIEDDKVAIDWYLWSTPDEPYRDNRMAPTLRQGSIGVLYKNELYNWKSGVDSLRPFGICEKPVSDNLWLIVRPPHGSNRVNGVTPPSDRSRLDWSDNSGSGDLPFDRWAKEFANNMPGPIIDALKQARRERPEQDDEDVNKWRIRLASRYGSRFTERYRPNLQAETTAGKDNAMPLRRVPAEEPKKRAYVPRPKTNNNRQTTVGPGISQPARPQRQIMNVPDCRFVDEQVSENPANAAVWTPESTVNPNGLVQIWRQHPAVKQVMRLLRDEYQGYQVERVDDAIEEVYKSAMAVRIMHSDCLRPLGGEILLDKLRSPESLTMSLLGIYPLDQVVRQKLAQSIGGRRRATKRKQAAE